MHIQCWNFTMEGWNCRLVHCPGGNTTDQIWRVLASSQGISSWTPLKPQHSNPNPNSISLANQLCCIDFLTPLKTSHHPPKTPCLPWISYATQKLMLDSCKMLQTQSYWMHHVCYIFIRWVHCVLKRGILPQHISFFAISVLVSLSLIYIEREMENKIIPKDRILEPVYILIGKDDYSYFRYIKCAFNIE